jgi:predicted dehydrogenase
MIKAGIIGLGKMGISHCSILNAHPDVDLVGACDTSKFLRWMLGKYSKIPVFDDYKKMIREQKPDCLFIATPTSSHFEIAKYCLENGIHLFLEKPCCLNYNDTVTLRDLARSNKLLIQVGYHNRYLGTFREVKRLIDENELGEIYHFVAEANGPVVVKENAETWRSDRKAGGGCLYDYASHVINLTNFILGDIDDVSGTYLKSVFSKSVEDAVYSNLHLTNGISGHLSVSWSEESFRKMSTKITVSGKKGRVEANAQEVKLYRNSANADSNRGAGWELTYLTDYTDPVNFYLRGEEYTAQVDDFIGHVSLGRLGSINSIESAGETDRVIELLIKDDTERLQANG